MVSGLPDNYGMQNTSTAPRPSTHPTHPPPYPAQLGNKVNKTRIKFTLSLISAVITILINGDEDIDRGVSAWVFPLMLVCGGLVIIADWHIRPQEYAVTPSSKCESCVDSRRGCSDSYQADQIARVHIASAKPTATLPREHHYSVPNYALAYQHCECFAVEGGTVKIFFSPSRLLEAGC